MRKTKANQVHDQSLESSSNVALSDQIQRALEMMKRVRAANAEQAEKALQIRWEQIRPARSRGVSCQPG